MSSVPDPNAALQAMLQAGQAMAQDFSAVLAKQQEMLQQGAAGAAPSGMPQQPQSEALTALQKDWSARQARLWQTMLEKPAVAGTSASEAGMVGDRRFNGPAWAESPVYDYLRQSYLINADYLKQVAEVSPVSDDLARNRLRFMTRQFIDAMAPSNFAATNPEFVKAALETKGESITRGLQNLIGDLEKGSISMTDDSAFEVGRNLAMTPGAVVFENELIQLIQYSPSTRMVAKRPLLIVPPCINKYYILDLQPENSFVRYAVDQGQTVFLVSWRNVQADQGHLTWDDYLEKGPLTAMRVVREICGTEQINALGFCVGGTIAECGAGGCQGARRRSGGVADTAYHAARIFGYRRDRLLRRRDLGGVPRDGYRQGRTAARQRTVVGVFGAARQRPDLAVRGRQLPQGRQTAGLRFALLERRRDESARSVPGVVPAQPVSGKQPARAGKTGDVRGSRRICAGSTCRYSFTPVAKTISCRGRPPISAAAWWVAKPPLSSALPVILRA